MAMRQGAYHFGRKVDIPFHEALSKTREALKAEGFGILCEIDVQKTLKEKLGVDFRPYVILGACNPPLAHQAFQAEINIGVLLPCNVVVYEVDGGARIEAMDPETVMASVGNPQLESLAMEVKSKLQMAIGQVVGVI